jgi:hypothetical protein
MISPCIESADITATDNKGPMFVRATRTNTDISNISKLISGSSCFVNFVFELHKLLEIFD